MAARTRSRASDRAASGSPTMWQTGRPGLTSTSTRTSAPCRPLTTAGTRVASIRRPYAERLIPGLSAGRWPRPAPWKRRSGTDGGQLRDGARTGHLLVDDPREVEDGASEQRVGLREHEGRAAVERADRGPVLVYH